MASVPPSTPPPAGPITVQQLPYINGDTTHDLMYNILLALGGNLSEVKQKYHDRGDDLLYAILEQLQLGGATPPPTGAAGSGLLSGNVTWSGVGLIFDVTACIYYINNQLYYSDAVSIELSEADPDNPRIDVFLLNTDGEADALTGDASATPEKPVLDPATQLELTFALVPAGATEPAGIVNDNIYQENAGAPLEWQAVTNNPATIDFENDVDPESGTNRIYVGTHQTGDYLEFQKGAVLLESNYQFLRFYLHRYFPAETTGPLMKVIFKLGGSIVTSSVVIQDGTYGYSSTGADWQLITIPLSAFNFTSSNFDRLLLVCQNTDAPEYAIDNIVLQGTAPATGGGGGGRFGIEDVSSDVGRAVNLNSGQLLINAGDASEETGALSQLVVKPNEVVAGSYGNNEIDGNATFGVEPGRISFGVSSSAGNHLIEFTPNGATFPKSITIADGTEDEGKVLTSDADGNASWQTPSGGGGGDLQTVLAAGNEADQSIILTGAVGTKFQVQQAGSTLRGLLGAGEMRLTNAAGFYGKLRSAFITANSNVEFPKQSGTMALQETSVQMLATITRSATESNSFIILAATQDLIITGLIAKFVSGAGVTSGPTGVCCKWFLNDDANDTIYLNANLGTLTFAGALYKYLEPRNSTVVPTGANIEIEIQDPSSADALMIQYYLYGHKA